MEFVKWKSNSQVVKVSDSRMLTGMVSVESFALQGFLKYPRMHL